MTKEDIIAALKGEKPKSSKINFSNKVGVATDEQAEYLEKILFQKDEQDSFSKVSRFISENIDDAKVKDVLQCHTVLVGVVALPLCTEIAKEGFAFSKDGYFCYAIRLMRNGVAFGVDKGSEIAVKPWPWYSPYGVDAVIDLVKSRKKQIAEKVGFMEFFRERDNEEIAGVIAKAFEQGVAE